MCDFFLAAPPKPTAPAATQPSKPKAIPTPAAPVRPSPIIDLKDRTEPIKGLRKAMVKMMTEAQNIPHFGYCDEINLTKLVEVKGHLKEMSEQRGIKFSYLPIFVKVCEDFANIFWDVIT